jgi:hypothetical protein
MINHFLWYDRNWFYRSCLTSLTPFKASWLQFRFCTFVAAGIRYRVDMRFCQQWQESSSLGCPVMCSLVVFCLLFCGMCCLTFAEDGGSWRPRKACTFLPKYTTLRVRRQHFSLRLCSFWVVVRNRTMALVTGTDFNWEPIFLRSLFL